MRRFLNGVEILPTVYLGPKVPREKNVSIALGDLTVTRYGSDWFSIDGGDNDYGNPDYISLTREEAERVIAMLRQVIDAPEEWT